MEKKKKKKKKKKQLDTGNRYDRMKKKEKKKKQSVSEYAPDNCDMVQRRCGKCVGGKGQRGRPLTAIPIT
ncbi:hypothetical protein E2C01_075904 [Portunus trituberculatus]|uniref:Uncharacterized protein n=1 Tax=Portunus trituberculatus TaxID=210409 RepID=A0A5B7IIB0_PORTR|nr:hypothetical protein [Portunus trituberculatus]